MIVSFEGLKGTVVFLNSNDLCSGAGGSPSINIDLVLENSVSNEGSITSNVVILSGILATSIRPLRRLTMERVGIVPFLHQLICYLLRFFTSTAEYDSVYLWIKVYDTF